jgi:hypothetical protein
MIYSRHTPHITTRLNEYPYKYVYICITALMVQGRVHVMIVLHLHFLGTVSLVVLAGPLPAVEGS